MQAARPLNSVEFMPNVVHPGNDYGEQWRIHHYGMPGHRAVVRTFWPLVAGDDAPLRYPVPSPHAGPVRIELRHVYPVGSPGPSDAPIARRSMDAQLAAPATRDGG